MMENVGAVVKYQQLTTVTSNPRRRDRNGIYPNGVCDGVQAALDGILRSSLSNIVLTSPGSANALPQERRWYPSNSLTRLHFPL